MRLPALLTVCLALVAAIVAAQWRHARAPVSPAPIVYFIAVARVGGVVAAGAHRKLPYHFSYIPDVRFVNAFALPGGHIFIGGGLIALMHTEDELAAVLGHEIEHVDHYHCAERVQLQARLRKLPVVSELLAIPIGLFQAGYTKEEELEADREGTRLAAGAGYAPTGAITLFETMARLEREALASRPRNKAATPQEEAASVGLETIEGYFQSYPPSDERVLQIQRIIAADRLANIRERSLLVEHVFITERAQGALDANTMTKR